MCDKEVGGGERRPEESSHHEIKNNAEIRQIALGRRLSAVYFSVSLSPIGKIHIMDSKMDRKFNQKYVSFYRKKQKGPGQPKAKTSHGTQVIILRIHHFQRTTLSQIIFGFTICF